jgi:alpha-1,2-mannosyltransferase
VRRFLPLLLLLAGLIGHLIFQAAPAWKKVHGSKGGRDFSSYYYAAEVALAGGNAYDTPALAAAAREDGTRKGINPFFYPPPFVLAVVWVKPFALQTAFELWFFVNELLLFACLGLGVWRFGVPLWAAAALLWTFTPIPDNAWMGQANLLALAPALAGLVLARTRPVVGGILVGTAAMFKMSPALFLLAWLLARNHRAVLAAMGTAVGLSLLTLGLVPLGVQTQFYFEILPGFSTGDYHGLTVPISLQANHSIPDLFDRLLPSAGDLLGDSARHASAATLAVLLALWAWRVRARPDSPASLGALTVLMVVAPVYTYEHHLVFLLVALGVAAGEVATMAGVARQAGRPGVAVAAWAALVAIWFFLAWPLPWLRAAQAALPADFAWLTRESKTMAEAGLFALLWWRAGAPEWPARPGR